MGSEERAAVDRVLRSGIIAQGPEVANFEEEFANMCGVKYAVATSNGTTAGHLAMLSNQIGPGDEVITTALSWISTSETISQTGARVVFCDIEEKSFTIDPEKIITVLNGVNQKKFFPKAWLAARRKKQDK